MSPLDAIGGYLSEVIGSNKSNVGIFYSILTHSNTYTQ